MSITKSWPIAGAAVDCTLAGWVARVLGGRDVVRVGEGEDEAFCMVLAATGAVPWKNAVSTKEMAIAGSDDGEGGSFVIAMLVKVSHCESISALLLVPVFFFFFVLYVSCFVLKVGHTQLPCRSAEICEEGSTLSACLHAWYHQRAHFSI